MDIEVSFLRKELDGWDPEDDPWAEHVSHAKVNNRSLILTDDSCFLVFIPYAISLSFSGEVCLCEPGEESKWTDSSWCEWIWAFTKLRLNFIFRSWVCWSQPRTGWCWQRYKISRFSNRYTCYDLILIQRWRRCGRPSSMRRPQQQEGKLTIWLPSLAEQIWHPSLAEMTIFSFSPFLETFVVWKITVPFVNILFSGMCSPFSMVFPKLVILT